MARRQMAVLMICTLLYATSCKEKETKIVATATDQEASFESNKKAILETITNETKAAFQRDYAGWQALWVHDSAVTKTYMNFTDSSFSAYVGWDTVNNFVRSFFEKHPKPEPMPTLVDDINLRLYGNGAWVSFEQFDSTRGLNRETRLMEKKDGQWKIAGMQTAIYGFKK